MTTRPTGGNKSQELSIDSRVLQSIQDELATGLTYLGKATTQPLSFRSYQEIVSTNRNCVDYAESAIMAIQGAIEGHPVGIGLRGIMGGDNGPTHLSGIRIVLDHEECGTFPLFLGVLHSEEPPAVFLPAQLLVSLGSASEPIVPDRPSSEPHVGQGPPSGLPIDTLRGKLRGRVDELQERLKELDASETPTPEMLDALLLAEGKVEALRDLLKDAVVEDLPEDQKNLQYIAEAQKKIIEVRQANVDSPAPSPPRVLAPLRGELLPLQKDLQALGRSLEAISVPTAREIADTVGGTIRGLLEGFDARLSAAVSKARPAPHGFSDPGGVANPKPLLDAVADLGGKLDVLLGRPLPPADPPEADHTAPLRSATEDRTMDTLRRELTGLKEAMEAWASGTDPSETVRQEHEKTRKHVDRRWQDGLSPLSQELRTMADQLSRLLQDILDRPGGGLDLGRLRRRLQEHQAQVAEMLRVRTDAVRSLGETLRGPERAVFDERFTTWAATFSGISVIPPELTNLDGDPDAVTAARLLQALMTLTSPEATVDRAFRNQDTAPIAVLVVLLRSLYADRATGAGQQRWSEAQGVCAQAGLEVLIPTVGDLTQEETDYAPPDAIERSTIPRGRIARVDAPGFRLTTNGRVVDRARVVLSSGSR